MIYLASPYTNPDPVVRELRFASACRAAAVLLARGVHVFSPIAHGHALTKTGIALPTEYPFWREYCLDMLGRCSELYVLWLAGWGESVGVIDEIKFAREHQMPISTVLWPDCEVVPALTEAEARRRGTPEAAVEYVERLESGEAGEQEGGSDQTPHSVD